MGVRQIGQVVLAAAAPLLTGLLLATPAALGATVSTDCAGLQGAINTASSHTNHGEGEVIVLHGLCNATDLKLKTGVTIPGESNVTIEGEAGTVSGFDGNGVEQPLLRSASFEAAGTLTIRNLTFQHANVTTGAGSAVQLDVTHVTLAADSFIENTLHGFGGGAAQVFVTAPGGKPVCQTTPDPAGATVVNDVFRANKVIGTSQASGGALVIAQICEYPESILEGNLFEANTVEQNGSGEAFGGAFTFEPGGEKPTPLIQRSNVFDSNQIISTSTTSDFGGGGEWTEGASLISVGDRFSRNTIPGAGSAKWSWGGGLGILNSSCESLSGGITASTVEDAVVTGNSIGAGSGDLGGAGIYVGCGPVPANPNHLTVRDSTVTENSVPAGGSAGIDGNPGDQLNLLNSIVADSGGPEIEGFNGPGGALSVSYSDVCTAGLSTPLAGTGNICADPKLANGGNPASVDVHETGTFPGQAGASPTIDAGSVAQVQPSLVSDFYGQPRTRTGIAPQTCSGPGVPPRFVDMGAGQHTPGLEAVPAIGIVCPKILKHSEFKFPTIAGRRNGVLILTFKGLSSGKLSALASFKVKRTIVKHKGGKKQVLHKTETVVYGRASVTVRAPATSKPLKGATVQITLKPTKRGLALLRRRRRMRVTLKVIYSQTGLLATAETKSIFVRYAPPRHHR
jgi:hypothetical protein